MTTPKKIAANRRNARKSTGPKSEEGKFRARQNAFRHGLTAETVITVFEDAEDYARFEEKVTADFDPQTAVEAQLVLRVASLLWRLRRALAIESGLFQIQGRIIHARRSQRRRNAGDPLKAFRDLLIHAHPGDAIEASSDSATTISDQPSSVDPSLCFLRITNLNGDVLERMGRYENSAMAPISANITNFKRYPPIRRHFTDNRTETDAIGYSQSQPGRRLLLLGNLPYAPSGRRRASAQFPLQRRPYGIVSKQFLEIGDRARKSGFQRRARLP